MDTEKPLIDLDVAEMNLKHEHAIPFKDYSVLRATDQQVKLGAVCFQFI